jgi:LAO/AO transport system ATPase
MIDELLDRLRCGDRAALSRLLSLAGQRTNVSAIMRALPAPPHPGRVIALTGSGGVGKSTLLGKLIDRARRANQTVAVLACDPQSPITGGALLGDRLRMGSRIDDGVFIRSLATPGARGAVADYLPSLLTVLEAFGFDVIFLETVGAGQGDTAVGDLANLVVLLIQPESGDELQWEKAGILEIADIVAVHKADLPGAEQTAADLRAALDLGQKQVPVVLVSSKTGTGLDELWQRINTKACPA